MGHIDMGNASIDRPELAKRYSYRKLLGTNELPAQVEGMLGVDVRGHRKYNHDMVSGFLAAAEVSPKHAGEIFLGHMMADKLSDQLRNSVGSGRRDLFEVLVDIQHTDAKKRKQRIRF